MDSNIPKYFKEQENMDMFLKSFVCTSGNLEYRNSWKVDVLFFENAELESSKSLKNGK